MATLDMFGAEMFRSPEDRERDRSTCKGCGKPKERGMIVCWHCFKYDANPYKYFEGTFEEWLATRKG